MQTITELDNEITRLKEELADKSANLQQMKKEAERKKREDERKRQLAENEAVKSEFAAHYNLVRDAKFNRAWDIAWDHGHGSGMNEVRAFFDELIDLIRP